MKYAHTRIVLTGRIPGRFRVSMFFYFYFSMPKNWGWCYENASTLFSWVSVGIGGYSEDLGREYVDVFVTFMQWSRCRTRDDSEKCLLYPPPGHTTYLSCRCSIQGDSVPLALRNVAAGGVLRLCVPVHTTDPVCRCSTERWLCVPVRTTDPCCGSPFYRLMFGDWSARLTRSSEPEKRSPRFTSRLCVTSCQVDT